MTAQLIVAAVWTVLAFVMTCTEIASIDKPREPRTAANVISGLVGSLLLTALIWWMAIS
jgi:hypothetical protein